MKLNTVLLTSCFMALMILPACTWWTNNNEPETLLIEEIVVVEPEMGSLQDEILEEALEEAEEINDLNMLNEK